MPAPLCLAALLDCYNLRPIPCPRFAPITFPVSLAIVMYKSFDKFGLGLIISPPPYSKLDKLSNGGEGGGGGSSDDCLGWGLPLFAFVCARSSKIHLALSRLQNWIGVTRIIYKLLIHHMIGTDVVYSEHLLDPLLQTIHDLSGPRTTIVLGYEIRSTSVHEEMLQMWKSNFDVKTVPRTKMDKKYQHPTIQLYVMEPKSSAEIALAVDQDKDQASDSKDRESDQKEEKMISMYEAENEKDTRDCAAATGVSS